jgi:putative iron-dependent peroxidase
MNNCAQSGILDSVPPQGRYLLFSLQGAATPESLRAGLLRLADLVDGQGTVVGVGLTLVQALGAQVPGLRTMPDFSGHGVLVPSTPVALWCWLRGSDRGDLVLRARDLEHALAPSFHLDRVLDAFRHGDPDAEHGRDLTGFEDGTENPQDGAAEQAALVSDGPPGMAGSSFVAVQQWLHNLDAFEAMDTQTQDNAIGRRRSDNEELDDAPASAHVKRTAQESFSPEAFVLRRSMPWAVSQQCGLFFVAFGHSLDAFEAQMRRMAGQEDGVVDALFGFSRPLSGAYLWCPPMHQGRLDWRQLECQV